ncbi:MAG TPA: SH3 domain-containing protein [Blastocatellia bacterium]|nr:SH3 domain-containing protein [Blastocatellia bacterium]
MRRTLSILGFLFLVSAVARASAPQEDVSPAPWQAVVSIESAPLYAAVSTSSRVVTVLRRGEAVTIALEVTGEDGKWYAVTAARESSAAGYVSGKVLDVPEQATVAQWEYVPPPDPTPESEKESVEGSSHRALAGRSSGRVQVDIKSFVSSKFGRTLPVSAFGQTRLHNHLGFDHRNGVDVALNPDSPEGQALLAKLRGFGIPYIAFRRAVPGVATGAHIHIGNPSPRK